MSHQYFIKLGDSLDCTIMKFSLLRSGILTMCLACLMSCGDRLPDEVKMAYQNLPTEVDFNFHVLPVLADKCYPCHGPDERAREADLRLDTEEAAFDTLPGGEGYAFVRGRTDQSEAIQRMLSHQNDLMMPPPDSKLSLSAEEKAILYKWVRDGATWKKHWSFIPPIKQPLPEVRDQAWITNEIDHFVLARIESAKRTPSPEASREELIRRLSFDLTGLPPTIDEVGDFLADQNPNAYDKLVDRLLASPHFGERWCWEWLDVARYADSNGFQGDPDRKMWPWRDWVIRAFNDNMPYDQFSIEQLAGDLLPDATHDQILATAFNRNHMFNGEGGRIPEETRVENVFDRVETFGTVWLGLTLNCSRCHDHKFDQLTQKEYYRLFDYFNQTSEEGIGPGGRIKPVLDLSDSLEIQEVLDIQQFVELSGKKLAEFEQKKFPRPEGLTAAASPEAMGLDGDNLYALGFEPVKRGQYYLGLLSNYYKERDPVYYRELQAFLKVNRQMDSLSARNLQVMVMDHLDKPRPSYVLDRGAYDKRGEEVTSGTPAVLPAMIESQTNNRLALAGWLFSDEHPLTARVIVNRYWQAIFGTGLVKTAEDFGVQGSRPTHPELLDWLAVYFRESGWDFKALIKMIVMSSTYRQSSRLSLESLEWDPENKWLARASRYRWPSWMLRDQALFVSGLLNDSLGGPPVKPYQPPGIWEEATFGKKKYKQDQGSDLYRRTLYVFWRRIVGPTMLFDNAARQTCEVKPVRTNTPLHALTTLNDITYTEAARVMAERVMFSADSDEERIKTAFRLATARYPDTEERGVLLNRLVRLKDEFSRKTDDARALIQIGEYPQNQSLDPVEQAAWAAVCSVILNLDEVLSRQ